MSPDLPATVTIPESVAWQQVVYEGIGRRPAISIAGATPFRRSRHATPPAAEAGGVGKFSSLAS